MNKKTLVILLLALLLVVLFVVSLLLAGRGPGSGLKFNPKSPGLARIANWLSRPAKAEHLALRSGSATDCRLGNDQIIIKAGAVCIYGVAADKLWTRKLRLVLLTPQDGLDGNVTVSLEQQEALKVEQTLVPGAQADPLDIYGRQDQAAATLVIQAPVSAVPDPTGYLIEVIEK
jgi:hypothetical protein